MMGGWYGDWGWGGWLAMGLMMVVFWGLLIALVVVLLRGTGSVHRHDWPAPSAGATDSAQRILDERFARGEIDAEEYRTRRDLLRSR